MDHQAFSAVAVVGGHAELRWSPEPSSACFPSTSHDEARERVQDDAAVDLALAVECSVMSVIYSWLGALRRNSRRDEIQRGDLGDPCSLGKSPGRKPLIPTRA